MPDLKKLCDRIAIEEHVHRYAHLLDSRRGDEVAHSIFTEDATLVFGDIVLEGREQIHLTMIAPKEIFSASSHIISNLMVVIEGDNARANFRLVSYNWLHASTDQPLAPYDMMTIGGYEDELVRHGEGWLVRHRRSYALGSGVGGPVPAQFREFMATVSKARTSWK